MEHTVRDQLPTGGSLTGTCKNFDTVVHIFHITNEDPRGPEMSTKLRESLMAYVAEELRVAYQDSPSEAASGANERDIVSEAIENAFEKLDRDVLDAGR